MCRPTPKADFTCLLNKTTCSMQSFDVHTSSDLKKNAFDDDQEAKLCQNYSDMSHNHVILHAKHNMCLAA